MTAPHLNAEQRRALGMLATSGHNGATQALLRRGLRRRGGRRSVPKTASRCPRSGRAWCARALRNYRRQRAAELARALGAWGELPVTHIFDA